MARMWIASAAAIPATSSGLLRKGMANTERISDLAFSASTAGLRGYSTLTALRELSSRRAVALAIGLSGESNAPVPLHDYGAKIAYRQRVLHEGLVLELRSSLTWPKDAPGERRRAAVGVGIGLEMFFGTENLLARPVTF